MAQERTEKRMKKSEVTGDVLVVEDDQQEQFTTGTKLEQFPLLEKLTTPSAQREGLRIITKKDVLNKNSDPEKLNFISERVRDLVLSAQTNLEKVVEERDENHDDGEEERRGPTAPRTSFPQGYPADGLWG